jgi:protein translocase SecG subunit
MINLMMAFSLISGVILIVLITLQVRDGGLNVSLTSNLQAPIERRGTAKTLHILTIVFAVIFIASCIANFLA